LRDRAILLIGAFTRYRSFQPPLWLAAVATHVLIRLSPK
jgi:hypothetical protein